MKWLLILFVGLIFVPTFAQNTQTNQTDYKKIDDSIKILQNEVDSMKKEINNTELLIKISNSQINTELNESANQDKSTYQLLKSYTDTSLTLENIKEKISDLQFLNSSLLSIVTTMIGIAGGAYITKRFERRKLENELKNVQQQMQKEFSRLHHDVWRAILDTRDVMRDQQSSSSDIINRLINRQTSVHGEFLSHIHGLHFILWDFALPHMNQFTESEKDQLMRIHTFITNADAELMNHHNVLKGRLQQILNSPSSNGVKASQMRDELIIDFNERMRMYCAVYRRIKNLDMDWLDWRTLELISQTPYSEMYNTLPNFVQRFLQWLFPEHFSTHQ